MIAAVRHAPMYILAPAVAAGAAMLLPIVYLVLRALEADPALLAELVWRSRNLQLLLNTLALTFGVLAVATVLAFPLAWLVARTDIAGARLITILGVLPLAVPGYVMAYALIGLGGNYGLMHQVFGIVMPRPQGLWGAVAALSLYTFPYLFLNLRAALSGMDRSLEETARSLGHGPWAVLSRVTVPHLVPALLAGWLVIGLYTLGDFGAVALMRYEVFSYAIYTQYAAAFDRIYAAWLSLMLIALTLCFVLAEPLLFGRRRYARVGTGTSRPMPPVRLGRYRWLAYAFVAAVFLASIGLPVTILAYWLTLTWPPAGLDQVGVVFMRSALASAPAALAAAVVALPIAYLSVRYPSLLSRLIERAAYLGYAIPPLTLALAFVFFSLRSAPWLYQTLTLLIIAYVISFLALALGPIRAALLQARPSLEEAARSLGYSSFQAFVWIVLPLVRRGALTGMILVFVIAMKELPITFLLAPTGYTTLAVTVFSRTSEAMLAEAAPFAAAIVLFSSLFVGVLLAYEGKR